jgi:hypothetical protein
MIGKRSLGWLPLVFVLLATSCAPQEDEPRDTGRGASSAKGTPAPAAVPASLKDRIDAALENARQRPLLTTHAFWTIFHGILGLGLDVTLLNPDTGQRVKAVDFVCDGGPIRGMEFVPTPDGLDVRTMVGTGVGQGHQDQFVAEMVQRGLSADRTFRINGHQYTFADFLRESRAHASVTKGQELSWTLLIVGQAFGTDASWTNNAGEKLSCEDLVRYEVHQPVESAACGGTHRLFGLTWVYHLYRARGGQTVGVWKEVADKIEHYKQVARRNRNPDGSLSTAYLSTLANSPDVQLRIGSWGHVIEWLSLAMSDQELAEPWIQEAVNHLTLAILNSRTDPIDNGAFYHAIHGLALYRARVFHAAMPGLEFP